VLRVAVRVARGGSAALRVAPRALTVGNLTRAASRAGKAVRVTAATGLAGWRSLSGWQKTLVLIDIWDKSADNVLPHNRAERWVTEQIGAALGAMFAKGDDVDEEEDARRLKKLDRNNRNNDRKRDKGRKRRSRKVKTGAAAVDQHNQLSKAKERDDRLIEGDHKSEQNVDTQLGHLRTEEDLEFWEEE